MKMSHVILKKYEMTLARKLAWFQDENNITESDFSLNVFDDLTSYRNNDLKW